MKQVVRVSANIELDLEQVFQETAKKYCDGNAEGVLLDDVLEYVARALLPLSERGWPGVYGPSDGPSINDFGDDFEKMDEALEGWKEAHR